MKAAQMLICGWDVFPAGSVAADATIRIWDLKTGKRLLLLEGHLAGVSTIAWSPDSKTLASGSDDKSIRLWDVATVGFCGFFSFPFTLSSLFSFGVVCKTNSSLFLVRIIGQTVSGCFSGSSQLHLLFGVFAEGEYAC